MTPPLGRITRRLFVSLAVVLALLLVFTGRLIDVQMVQAQSLQSTAAEQLEATATITAQRGRILDRNGNVLAQTVLRYNVVVDQRNVGDYHDGDNIITVADVAAKLATITTQSQATIMTALTGTNAYSKVAEGLDVTAYEQVRALDVPWLLYETSSYRTYPSGAVAGNLLGYLGTDSTALAGIEYADNTCLTGSDGEETYVRSGSSSSVRLPGTTRITTAAVNGGDITLTIDKDVQWYAQQVAAQASKAVGAQWASIVVQDAKTGDLLAVADAPSVDPSNFLAVDAADRGARAFQAAFEPGSTFKAITAASALEEGVTTPTSQYSVPGSRITSIGTKISDAFSHGVMNLTTTGILRYSSNVGITEVGEKMSTDTRYSYLQKFGVGTKTSVDFPGESSGTLLPTSSWDVHSALTEMFGQGPVAASPVQITDVFQTIANGGQRISPRLVESCTSGDGTVTTIPRSTPVQAVSKSSANQTVDMLENVVNQGGAPIAAVDGYRVAGKTGTGQIAENGKYIDGAYTLSFVGMAPAEDPQYIVGVYAYKATGQTWNYSAGFANMMSYVLKKYDVPPSTTQAPVLPITW